MSGGKNSNLLGTKHADCRLLDNCSAGAGGTQYEAFNLAHLMMVFGFIRIDEEDLLGDVQHDCVLD